MLIFFNFTLFPAIFLFQSSAVHSTIHLSTFFRYFNHAQHYQKMQQQQPREINQCSTSETNLNNSELLSKSAKMQYTASVNDSFNLLRRFSWFSDKKKRDQKSWVYDRGTITLIVTYSNRSLLPVNIWSLLGTALKIQFGSCKEKCIQSENNETQLFFKMNAFSDLNLLTECFLHFYLTNSDANGQFELKHNFLGENMGKNNICWPTFCDSSDDCKSKCWSGNKQKFKDPNRKMFIYK